MSLRARYGLFGVSAAILGALFVWAITGLPAFGDFHGEYGRILNGVAVHERHATNVVVAVTFDYRGFDTLGEEFILFAAVTGVALLLREARDREQERPYDAAHSDAVRGIGLTLVPAAVVLGLYVIAHGTLTPGGGFQGGVVTASGLVLVYAAGQYRAYRASSPQALVDLAEGTGAGGFAAVGIASLVAGFAFLYNFLPLGTTGSLASAGTITVENAAVGLEVTAALVLLFHEFLEELMDPTSPGGQPREAGV